MKPEQLEQYLQFSIPRKFKSLIKGKPGYGKTAIIEQAVKKLGYDLMVSHPVISESVDYRGLPYAKDGEADFLPFGELKDLINAKKPLVCFFDDFGQAPVSVQASIMQLLHGGRIGKHFVSSHVIFLAATNDKSHGAGVTGLLNPVKSRFHTIIELEVNADDWSSWAIANGLPVELAAFIRYKPEVLEKAVLSKEMVNTVSPRSLSYVGDLLNAGLPKSMEYEVISGAAGEGFAIEFGSYRNLYKELPDIDYIMANPDTAKIPTNAAILHTLDTVLGARIDNQTIAPIMRYLNRMGAEHLVVAMIIAGKKHKATKDQPDSIFRTAAYRDFVINNHQLMD